MPLSNKTEKTRMDSELGMSELTENIRAVLAAIFSGGEVTRAHIGNAVGLSRPTVSIAVSALENAGLVIPVGSQQGPLGRSTTVYAIAKSSGWIMGVSVEADCLRIVARGLNGTEIASVARPLAGDNVSAATAINEETRRIVRDTATTMGPLRGVGIALERIIPHFLSKGADPRTGLANSRELFDSLKSLAGVPLLVENAANCAAMAEAIYGASSIVDEFVYLQVGVKIGSGIVSEGRILRGASGGAGEISALPSSLLGAGDDGSHVGPEQYLGARQLLGRAADLWHDGEDGPAPTTIKALSEYARRGNLSASRVLADESANICRVALALAAVVDPGLIILDGEVGRDGEILRQVSELIRARRPDLRVQSGLLGNQATVEGATAIALDHSLERLIGPSQQHNLHARVVRLSHIDNLDASLRVPPPKAPVQARRLGVNR